jgi:hypothetical protein
MISRRLILALVAVALTPPVIALAFRQPPPAKYVAPPTLSDRLNEVDADLPAAKKEDRLPEVRAIRTIPITQPEPPAAVIGAAATERLRSVVLTPPPEAEDDPPPRHRKAKATRRASSGDVCSRHGMRKVTIRGGKSWRCRRR